MFRLHKTIFSSLIFLLTLTSFCMAAPSPEELEQFNQQLASERQVFEAKLKNDIANDPRRLEVAEAEKRKRDAYQSLLQRSNGADQAQQSAMLADYQAFLSKNKKDLQLKLKDINNQIQKEFAEKRKDPAKTKFKYISQPSFRVDELKKEFARKQAEKIDQFLNS